MLSVAKTTGRPRVALKALATGRKVPDCHYLALAEREGAAIATADRVLDRTAAELGVPTLFIET